VTIETAGFGWASWKTYAQLGHGVATFKDEVVKLVNQILDNAKSGECKYNGLDNLLDNQNNYIKPSNKLGK